MLNPTSRIASAALGILFLGVVLSACASDEKPTLQPIEAQTVRVNETLSLLLAVENPSGLPLEFSVEDPSLPSFDEVTLLSETPTGAVFRWTPLASHVGSHELTFTIKSDAGSDSETVVIDVVPAGNAAPVFLRPGFGGTFDLGDEPCARFDVEVRDDDSSNIEIRPRSPLPEGAVLRPNPESSKRADFEWCPTEEQVQRSLRWNVEIEADDTDHVPPTPHDYLLVLRTPTNGNCTTQPPNIMVTAPSEGETLGGVGGYPVDVTVTDDLGVRDDPILYYSSNPPPENPSVTDFDQQRIFQRTGADTWRAIIPPLDIVEGEQVTLYYMVSATDNDDPMGTGCDQTSESAVRNFTARGASPDEKVPDCGFCSNSTQCESGICAADGGGTCLPGCVDGIFCDLGSCDFATTVNGESLSACVDLATVCGGGMVGECMNDANEPDDTIETGSVVSGSTTGTICPGDVDHWGVTPASDTQYTFTLDGFDLSTADLDLSLVELDGTTIEVSGGTGATESIEHCVEGGEVAVARVYAYGAEQQSDYTLTVSESAGSCCMNDRNEPDNSAGTARMAGVDGAFDGNICPNDIDYISFNVTAPKSLTILVIFDDTNVDLDLLLYGPDGGFLAGTWENGDQEELTWDASVSGVYKVKIQPFGDGETTYAGEITQADVGDCTTTVDCPLFNVCNGGSCVSDNCSTVADCPSNHLCPDAGPGQTYGFCSMNCSINTDCRSGEACKWFTAGRACGQTGTGQNGEACSFFETCGGQRDCFDWPGGYCARVGCQSDSDCESNTFCSAVGGNNVCVRKCGGVEPPCRLAEGYSCLTRPAVGGGMQQGCFTP